MFSKYSHGILGVVFTEKEREEKPKEKRRHEKMKEKKTKKKRGEKRDRR